MSSNERKGSAGGKDSGEGMLVFLAAMAWLEDCVQMRSRDSGTEAPPEESSELAGETRATFYDVCVNSISLTGGARYTYTLSVALVVVAPKVAPA